MVLKLSDRGLNGTKISARSPMVSSQWMTCGSKVRSQPTDPDRDLTPLGELPSTILSPFSSSSSSLPLFSSISSTSSSSKTKDPSKSFLQYSLRHSFVKITIIIFCFTSRCGKIMPSLLLPISLLLLVFSLLFGVRQ